MRRYFLPALAFCTLFVMFAETALAQQWSTLSPVQQQALAPLSSEWDALSEKQQKHFMKIAQHFPQLNKIQQQRLHARLEKWSKLTPEQRQQARKKYNLIQKLPPEKREALKKTLREKHSAQQQNLPVSAVSQSCGISSVIEESNVSAARCAK